MKITQDKHFKENQVCTHTKIYQEVDLEQQQIFLVFKDQTVVETEPLTWNLEG